LYYNGELLVESGQDETVTSRYLLGYGVAAGWQKGKEGYHSYHLDEQNSTAYIIDSGQRIENSYQYNAFGGIRSNNEKIHNRILYTGQQYDQVTGQYYLRARYYNPVLGRFMQEDPYRGDGLSLYNYCRNNPLKYYDPSGFAKKFSLADYKIPYSGKSRPNFDSGLVQGVWDNAPRNISGNVYNVRNPEIELFWDKNKNRYDQWHMGHLEGHEYSDLHADYISDMNQLIADLEPYENVLSDKTKKKILKSRIDEFKGEYNNAGNYAPEDPDINMSHKNEAKKEKNDKCKG
jgi:RHS repeat-associated protein